MSDHVEDVLKKCLVMLKNYREDCVNYGFSGIAEEITEVETEVEVILSGAITQNDRLAIPIVDETGAFLPLRKIEETVLKIALLTSNSMSKIAQGLQVGRSTLYRKKSLMETGRRVGY
jgi:transcriptional regulator with PAS, ATPase and Fis domain